jgi:Raf kinase inhibitor-like YbhB/YbcL family protein
MRTKIPGFILLVAAAVLNLHPLAALAKVQAGDVSALALDRVLSPAIQPLTVSSPAAQPGKPMPDAYTAFGKDLSPPVSWDGVPPGVRSYVIVMEDPDAHTATPALHWLVYNIPGTAKGIGRNLRNKGEPIPSLGVLQGRNYAGGVGYLGPNPPPGDRPHHYHIEVFALASLLRLHPGVSLDKVIAAMNDNVLADGEVVVTAAPPPGPAPDPIPAAAPPH